MAEKEKYPKRLIMYCEGDTEKNYIDKVLFNGDGVGFTGFFNKASIGQYLPLQGPIKRGVRSLLKSAVLDAITNPNAIIWCFIDGDVLIKDKVLTKELVKNLKRYQSQIHVCITNPCIEFWFLLHVEDVGRAFKNCDDVQLKKHPLFKNYMKPHAHKELTLKDKSFFEKALKRAIILSGSRQLTEVKLPDLTEYKNPCTGMPSFINFLTEQSNLTNDPT